MLIMKKIVNVKSTVKIILASVAFCGALLNPISGMAAESGSVCSSITATGNPEYPPFCGNKSKQVSSVEPLLI